jgi:tetratricopeptide (TPR) repeat protein
MLEKAQYDRAEELLTESLAIHRQSNGEIHTAVAFRLNDIGRLHYGRGNYDDAERLHRQAYEMYKEIHAGPHTDIAISLGYLSRTRHARGDVDGALEFQEQAVEIAREVRVEDNPLRLILEIEYADLLQKKNRIDEAAAIKTNSLAMMEKKLPDDHPRVAAARHSMASLYAETGDLERARRLYEKALETRRKLPPLNPGLASTKIGLGTVLCETGDTRNAAVLIEEGLSIYRASLPDDDPRIVRAREKLDRCPGTHSRR